MCGIQFDTARDNPVKSRKLGWPRALDGKSIVLFLFCQSWLSTTLVNIVCIAYIRNYVSMDIYVWYISDEVIGDVEGHG